MFTANAPNYAIKILIPSNNLIRSSVYKHFYLNNRHYTFYQETIQQQTSKEKQTHMHRQQKTRQIQTDKREMRDE